VRDAWKRHAAITLRGDDALELAAAIDGWRDALVTEADPDDDA
jgi:hypothetical protein